MKRAIIFTVSMLMLLGVAQAQRLQVSELSKEKITEMEKTEEGICQLSTLSLFMVTQYKPQYVPLILSSTINGNEKIVITETEKSNGSKLKHSCTFVKEKNKQNKLVYRFSGSGTP